MGMGTSRAKRSPGPVLWLGVLACVLCAGFGWAQEALDSLRLVSPDKQGIALGNVVKDQPSLVMIARGDSPGVAETLPVWNRYRERYQVLLLEASTAEPTLWNLYPHWRTEINSLVTYDEGLLALLPIFALYEEGGWKVVERGWRGEVLVPKSAPKLPREHLVGEWLFNGTTRDLSRNSFHAVAHGCGFGTDRNGKPSSALLFDGKGDYLDFGFLPTGGKMTLTFRINWEEFEPDQQLFSFGDLESGNGIALSVSKGTNPFEGNKLEFVCSDEEGSLDTVSTDALFRAGAWFHLGVTLAAEGDVAFYLDGNEIGSGKLASVPRARIRASNRAGAAGGRKTATFKGRMDDVRLYDRALTSEEMLRVAFPEAIEAPENQHIGAWEITLLTPEPLPRRVVVRPRDGGFSANVEGFEQTFGVAIDHSRWLLTSEGTTFRGFRRSNWVMGEVRQRGRQRVLFVGRRADSEFPSIRFDDLDLLDGSLKGWRRQENNFRLVGSTLVGSGRRSHREVSWPGQFRDFMFEVTTFSPSDTPGVYADAWYQIKARHQPGREKVFVQWQGDYLKHAGSNTQGFVSPGKDIRLPDGLPYVWRFIALGPHGQIWYRKGGSTDWNLVWDSDSLKDIYGTFTFQAGEPSGAPEFKNPRVIVWK